MRVVEMVMVEGMFMVVKVMDNVVLIVLRLSGVGIVELSVFVSRKMNVVFIGLVWYLKVINVI